MNARKEIINMYFATHKTCNLSCRYCYIPEKDRLRPKKKDSEIIESLSKLIHKAEDENYTIGVFCLHGTEPSLLEPQSIIRIIGLIEAYWTKKGIRHKRTAMQTNGLRLGPNYLSEIEKKTGTDKLRIGFSIDFPRPVHDYMRNNTYDKVINNFEYAKSIGFEVSVLTVVTGMTIDYLDLFIGEMKEQLENKTVYGNPCKVKIKLATGSYAPDEQQIEILSRALIENNLLNLVQILTPGYCVQNGNECMWFEFDTDGNCYSCNKTYFEGGSFANWHNDSFDDIFARRKRLFSEVPVHTDCASCNREYLCNSGCPVDRYKSGPMAGKAHECTMLKMAYDHMESKGIHILDFFDNNV